MTSFKNALKAWREAALKLSVSEGEYAKAYAKALAASEARTEKLREADAELATEDMRQARDLARIEERSAKWVVEYLMRHPEVAA